MPVYELKTAMPGALVDQVEELLAELEEQRLMVLEDKPSAQAWLAGYFDSSDEALRTWNIFVEAAGSAWSTMKPELRELPDVDWKESYKAHFKASKFGRLNWVPVWEREAFLLPKGEEVLWLDPGMAFGTGNHETTRLCCERLASHAALKDTAAKVIDAGCGSGILALSAAKLGFRDICGFDNDAEAIRVSCENAELNGLAGKMNFYVGDLVTGLMGREAGLVMANIQADILMRFANELCAAVASDGELVLSGILAHELDQVRAKFSAVTKTWTIDSRVLGEWADLRLRR
ncbi:MAG TPA: 50S ribosomal protein L11 methyltransferase [Lacunisphaera sp.]|jgi:ribosomal protein L11 methyltransferase